MSKKTEISGKRPEQIWQKKPSTFDLRVSESIWRASKPNDVANALSGGSRISLAAPIESEIFRSAFKFGFWSVFTCANLQAKISSDALCSFHTVDTLVRSVRKQLFVRIWQLARPNDVPCRPSDFAMAPNASSCPTQLNCPIHERFERISKLAKLKEDEYNERNTTREIERGEYDKEIRGNITKEYDKGIQQEHYAGRS